MFTEGDTMTPLQAAQVLGVSRPAIYQFFRDGLLQDRRVGTHRMIPAQSVHQLVADRRRAADHAAELLRDDPDHPRVRAARERVRARRAARQA